MIMVMMTTSDPSGAAATDEGGQQVNRHIQAALIGRQ
jgi:hypothetical protein